MIQTVLQYEWLLFRRNALLWGMWLFLLLAGLYALQYGHVFHRSQASLIHTLDTAYQKRIQKQISHFASDTATEEGKNHYRVAHDAFMNEYHTHPVIWKAPQPLQALSIGQSDNQPFYNNLWLYDDFIYSNKEVELHNPEKLLAGNFDLAFLIIYLLPLFVIAYSYAVVGGDKEAGVAALLYAQGVSLKRIMVGRLFFRLLVLGALVILLNTSGFIINGLSDPGLISYWMATSLLYLLFWFALVYAVLSFKKSSAVTALILVGCWIFSLVLVPSFVNASATHHDAEHVQLSDADREYSIHLWDLWQSKTTALPDTLFREMPHWRKYGIKDTDDVKSVGYSYFNMLYMNRLGARMDSLAVVEQNGLQRLNIINPAFVTQLSFNLLASTELFSYVAYRKAAVDYQKKRAEVIHRLRLSGEPFTPAVFKSYPQFKQPNLGISFTQWAYQLLPLVLLTVLCVVAGILCDNKVAAYKANDD